MQVKRITCVICNRLLEAGREVEARSTAWRHSQNLSHCREKEAGKLDESQARSMHDLYFSETFSFPPRSMCSFLRVLTMQKIS